MKKKKSKNNSKKGFKKSWNNFWEPGIKHTDGAKKGKVSIGRAVGKPASVLGAGVAGGAIGALGGIWTPFIGFALMVGGPLLKDKSGLMSVGGAAMMAYGIAKAQENHAAKDAGSVNGLGSLSGAKDRLLDFKDNFLKAFFIDKLSKNKGSTTVDDEATMGAIDLSQLDALEDLTKQSAYNYEMRRSIEDERDLEDYPNYAIESEDTVDEDLVDDLEGPGYTIIEEEEPIVDLSTI
ncbi:MAG: hypothetical protein HUJ25_07590 [Crocinitomicaceae bacterium]|nr:hypothetical protein [Crocinitomicaceae bacterium]